MNFFFALCGCGEPCWEAKDDECRCSCGGANHGIRRKNPTAQVERTMVAHSSIYVLKRVAAYLAPKPDDMARPEDLIPQANQINRDAGVFYWPRAATERDPMGYTPVAIVRPLTKAQVNRWPEAAHWRAQTPEMALCLSIHGQPRALWVLDAKATALAQANTPAPSLSV